jgi:hypothetical protein
MSSLPGPEADQAFSQQNMRFIVLMLRSLWRYLYANDPLLAPSRDNLDDYNLQTYCGVALPVAGATPRRSVKNQSMTKIFHIAALAVGLTTLIAISSSRHLENWPNFELHSYFAQIVGSIELSSMNKKAP